MHDREFNRSTNTMLQGVWEQYESCFLSGGVLGEFRAKGPTPVAVQVTVQDTLPWGPEGGWRGVRGPKFWEHQPTQTAPPPVGVMMS